MIREIPEHRPQQWFLFERELRRRYSTSAWVPLRASVERRVGKANEIGHILDGIYVGTAAFTKSNREIGDRVSWHDIGVGSSPAPHAFNNGTYKLASEYQYNDGETVGHNIILDGGSWHPEIKTWIIDPDLTLALRLINENGKWICPTENYIEVIREEQTPSGFRFIEIRREWLLDYLSARRLNLRLSSYRQRVENFPDFESCPFEADADINDDRQDANFALRINTLNDVFGGTVAMFRVGHNDFDEEEDAPDLSNSTDEDTFSERAHYARPHLAGVRVASEFWRDEWIDHNNYSPRVRGDPPNAFPSFITETDGTEISSHILNHEEIGRWLYFRLDVISTLLNNRGFSIRWHSDTTASVDSDNDASVHFGINESERIVVYAEDIARLRLWQQRIWQSHNITPEGGVGKELGAAQIKSQPPETTPPEVSARECVEQFADAFEFNFETTLFTDSILQEDDWQKISRFSVRDDASLMKLAKELHRTFADRISKQNLITISTLQERKELGTLKLLEALCADRIGATEARKLMSPLVGIYELRLGDAHPVSSKIDAAYELCEIDRSRSYYDQGYQLIDVFWTTLCEIGNCLFSSKTSSDE